MTILSEIYIVYDCKIMDIIYTSMSLNKTLLYIKKNLIKKPINIIKIICKNLFLL